jgi:peptidoglycan-associated lipoprotein
MIRTHRGRGGSDSNPGAGLMRAGVIAVIMIALALTACSSQKKPGEGAGAGGPGQGGIGEGGVGPGGESSLSGLQKGTLGKNEQGPLGDIHFDYNDYSVRAQDGEILRANADWLQKNAANRVQIEGHCDERGSEEYNIALGARRAQAAKDYLQTLGVAADRMSTISYGKELPLCTEHTEDCWEQNRRDHFVVTQ